MTLFWNRIAVWSSLHDPVRIYRSFYGSAFESPVYRVHTNTNPNWVKAPVTELGLHEWICNAATRNRTHELTRTYTRTHGQAYIRISIHIHTIFLHIYTYTTNTYSYTPQYNYTHIKTNTITHTHGITHSHLHHTQAGHNTHTHLKHTM